MTNPHQMPADHSYHVANVEVARATARHLNLMSTSPNYRVQARAYPGTKGFGVFGPDGFLVLHIPTAEEIWKAGA